MACSRSISTAFRDPNQRLSERSGPSFELEVGADRSAGVVPSIGE
jgi:hypothetical protein